MRLGQKYIIYVQNITFRVVRMINHYLRSKSVEMEKSDIFAIIGRQTLAVIFSQWSRATSDSFGHAESQTV